MKKLCDIFLLSLVLYGCTDLEDPNDVNLDNKIAIIIPSLSTDSTLNDKGTLAIIQARIPESAGQLDITFTTTAGLFLESNDKAVKQLVDEIRDGFRYATVTLKTDTVKVTDKKAVYISAEALTDRDRVKIYYKKIP